MCCSVRRRGVESKGGNKGGVVLWYYYYISYMRKKFSLYIVIIAIGTIVPLSSTYAHETRTLEIGGAVYEFTVGHLKEPMVVDESNIVTLDVRFVAETTPLPEILTEGDVSTGDEAFTDEATPLLEPEAAHIVENLDTLLQFEAQAGDVRKVFPLVPAGDTPGKYETLFIPTGVEQFGYRLSGTFRDTFVDVLFSCNPEGETDEQQDFKRNELSPGVLQLARRGSFGCPVSRIELGFPHEAVSGADVALRSEEALANASQAKKAARSGRIFGIAGGLFGIVGVFLAVSSMMKHRQNQV